MSRHFVFSVRDLQTGGRDYQSPITPAWLTSVLQDSDLSPFEGQSGELTVRLSVSGRDIVAHGRVRVPVAVPCARCLTPVRLQVDSELALLFVPGQRTAAGAKAGTADKPKLAAAGKSKAAGKQAPADKPERAEKRPANPGFHKGRWSREGNEEVYEFSGEDADICSYDGDDVVLDDHVRELILLETPIFPLCSEACPGIRATPEQRPDPTIESGDTVPIDPRLRPLLKLQKKKD